MAAMKTKLVALVGALTLTVWICGCYSKVSGGHRVGIPKKDKVEGRYERSVSEVYTAAKQVLEQNGTLDSENVLYSQTNAVKTMTGRVSQKWVWIRVEQIDPKLTQVTVQARGSSGGPNIDMTHELEKQIALRLVR